MISLLSDLSDQDWEKAKKAAEGIEKLFTDLDISVAQGVAACTLVLGKGLHYFFSGLGTPNAIAVANFFAAIPSQLAMTYFKALEGEKKLASQSAERGPIE